MKTISVKIKDSLKNESLNALSILQGRVWGNLFLLDMEVANDCTHPFESALNVTDYRLAGLNYTRKETKTGILYC